MSPKLWKVFKFALLFLTLITFCEVLFHNQTVLMFEIARDDFEHEPVSHTDNEKYTNRPSMKRTYIEGQVESGAEIKEKTVQKDDTGAQVKPVQFDMNDRDVLVYLHIQKTSGTTFEEHLVEDLKVTPPCVCVNISKTIAKEIQCECLNSHGYNWMFHRHTVRWPCGVHADFTELTDCVDDWFQEIEGNSRTRIYHYATTLREPVDRFLSEWRMVQRGGSWTNFHRCGGRQSTLEEIPLCHNTSLWTGVSLRDFINCKSNLAFNRQTRMLANLTLSDCYRLDSKYSRKERDAIMLQSAKYNLRNFFEYFGLAEYQIQSAVLFQKTFLGLHFDFQRFRIHPTTGHAALSKLTLTEIKLIREKNALDIELYRFAKVLFLSRLQEIGFKIKV